jgi:hypothetical protein
VLGGVADGGGEDDAAPRGGGAAGEGEGWLISHLRRILHVNLSTSANLL